MAASKGRGFLLQIGDGATSEAFNTIAGGRSLDITVNNETVDVTDKGSNGWRGLLDGAGTQAVTVNFSGVFKDDTYGKSARTKVLADTQNNFRILDTDTGDYFSGTFQITSFSQSGEFNGPVEFSMTLESSGEITHTEV